MVIKKKSEIIPKKKKHFPNTENMGRPREHDRTQVAKNLIEWAKRDDAINLNKFCALFCDPPIPPVYLHRWSDDDEFFRLALDTAKAFVAFRREEYLSAELLHVKAYDLNAHVYDAFTRLGRRAEAKYDVDIKKDALKEVSAVEEQKYQAMMNQISSIQSDLKIDKTKAAKE